MLVHTEIKWISALPYTSKNDTVPVWFVDCAETHVLQLNRYDGKHRGDYTLYLHLISIKKVASNYET